MMDFDFIEVSKLSEKLATSNSLGQDEDELGDTEPEAFKLRPEDFKTGSEYVKAYVRTIRKLHFSDAKNEARRRESLGYYFKTENLQPKALRKALVDNQNQPLQGKSYFVTAIVPILKETYRAKFNGTKKPTYTRIDATLMKDQFVMGVLTSAPSGHIPPVTLCEQYNDLRADEDANTVFTYTFAQMDGNTQSVRVSNPDQIITTIKN